jgi:hypothetical protein
MNILTLIQAARGVRPFLPCIVLLPLAPGACSGAGSKTAADVAALEARLTAAEDVAVAIDDIRLPPCAPSNGASCSDSTVVARIKTADMRAHTLVKGADQTVGDAAVVSTAQAAVTAFIGITTSLPQPGRQ